jgi:hypothetical protein
LVAISKYTVHQGEGYKATLQLGFFQGWANNETIADYIRKAGFAQVKVTGSGRRREATGTWPLPDATAEVPDEVIAVDQIEV